MRQVSQVEKVAVSKIGAWGFAGHQAGAGVMVDIDGDPVSDAPDLSEVEYVGWIYLPLSLRNQ